MTEATVTTTVNLKSGQVARLAALAERLGYRQTRGSGAGKLGSISQLMQALAEDPQSTARRIVEVGDETQNRD